MEVKSTAKRLVLAFLHLPVACDGSELPSFHVISIMAARGMAPRSSNTMPCTPSTPAPKISLAVERDEGS